MLVVWRADGKTSVQLEVFVDMRDAVRLNAGKDQLRDNLIIRIDGGEDICVSFDMFLLTYGLKLTISYTHAERCE